MRKGDSFGKLITNHETNFINNEFDSIAEKPNLADKLSKSLDQDTELRTKELLFAYNQIAFQNQEKENLTKELELVKSELQFQNQEKENRAKELLVANFEMAFQNQEKKNRAKELVKANSDLAFLNNDKIKKAKELLIANDEIKSQIKLRAEESLLSDELKKTEKSLTSHVNGLETIIFLTSHKIRHPIANILGLIELMTYSVNSPNEMIKQIEYLKQAAITLDECTKELSAYMNKLQHQNDDLKK